MILGPVVLSVCLPCELSTEKAVASSEHEPKTRKLVGSFVRQGFAIGINVMVYLLV